MVATAPKSQVGATSLLDILPRTSTDCSVASPRQKKVRRTHTILDFPRGGQLLAAYRRCECEYFLHTKLMYCINEQRLACIVLQMLAGNYSALTKSGFVQKQS